MIDISRIYGLSIDLDNLKEFRSKIEFKQYDYKTSFIAFKFYKGETLIENIDENYIIGVFKDSEDNLFVDSNGLPVKTYAFNHEEEEGVVILPISREVIRKSGKMSCEIIIINKKGLRVTSPRFNFTIQPSLYEYEYEVEEPIETVCGTFRSGEKICGYGNVEKIDIKKYITYEKTVWVDGETLVNQERLNNIEDGIYNVSEHLNIVENNMNDISEYLSNIEDSFSANQERLSNVENNMSDISEHLNNIEEDFNNISENFNKIDANSIKYETSADETITTIQDALDKLLYVPLTINLTCNRSTIEKGEVVTPLTFNWNYNKKIIEQKFNNILLDNDLRSYKIEEPVTTDRTFTLVANDGKNVVSKSSSIKFYNGRYWGVSSSEQYDSDFIKSLSKELSSNRTKTFSVHCGEGQHIFYCIPSNFGNPVFTVGGFSGGFYKVSTIQFSNSYGYVESYDIWKSNNNNLGDTTVVVS